ncbi:MAG TPA: alpha/beta hydrolase [Chitinophagales bacterium]|nr:alpha/beta hydrolase [Chitinophagales bacterium]
MTKTIYLIPGVGANDRVFGELELPDYEVVHIKWPKHKKGESLQSYVKKLLPQIKKDTQPILIGLSFGGIVAIELAKLLDPYKTILISSIKTYHERPLKLMFLNSLKFHRLLPGKLVVQFRFWLNWLLGRLSKKDLELVELMIQEADIEFNEWAVDQVIHWKNEEIIDNLVHIHGTGDRIFPSFYVKGAIWIKGGSHFMVVNRAKEISKIIRKELLSAREIRLSHKKPLQKAS